LETNSNCEWPINAQGCLVKCGRPAGRNFSDVDRVFFSLTSTMDISATVGCTGIESKLIVDGMKIADRNSIRKLRDISYRWICDWKQMPYIFTTGTSGFGGHQTIMACQSGSVNPVPLASLSDEAQREVKKNSAIKHKLPSGEIVIVRRMMLTIQGKSTVVIGPGDARCLMEAARYPS